MGIPRGDGSVRNRRFASPTRSRFLKRGVPFVGSVPAVQRLHDSLAVHGRTAGANGGHWCANPAAVKEKGGPEATLPISKQKTTPSLAAPRFWQERVRGRV